MSGALVRVITTCTSRKVVGGQTLAERLYVGEQHRRLMDGVGYLRRLLNVEVWIISAKAGVIAGDEVLTLTTNPSRGSDATRFDAKARPSESLAISARSAACPHGSRWCSPVTSTSMPHG